MLKLWSFSYCQPWTQMIQMKMPNSNSFAPIRWKSVNSHIQHKPKGMEKKNSDGRDDKEILHLPLLIIVPTTDKEGRMEAARRGRVGCLVEGVLATLAQGLGLQLPRLVRLRHVFGTCCFHRYTRDNGFYSREIEHSLSQGRQCTHNVCLFLRNKLLYVPYLFSPSQFISLVHHWKIC